MRFASKGFRLFAVGAALVIVAIYFVHSSLITASEDAVERSARYDVAWVGAGGRLSYFLHIPVYPTLVLQ